MMKTAQPGYRYDSGLGARVRFQVSVIKTGVVSGDSWNAGGSLET